MILNKFAHRTLILAFHLCLWCTYVPAQSIPLELKWNELTPLIGGQMVQMVLPDSTTIKGEAIAVREDALLMDIKRTSNPSVHPKGNALIPKASVNLIRLERRRGSWGRSLGTVVGVLTGVVVGAYTAATTTDSAAAGIPVFLGIAGGVSVGGYLIGREVDKRTMMIKIVP
jgi:hypothetical protein